MEITYEVFNAGGLPIHWSSFFPFGASDKQQTATAPQPARFRQAAEQPKRRILVVDDHRDTLRSMKLLLTRLGYQVLAAENMTDALRIAEEEHFDILLSDIGLPDGSGHELLKRISKMRNVPALALSGFGMDEDLQRSRDAGFSDHLTKPVSLDRLQCAIAELDAQAG
jgi:CheY-like chemotaxis protein